MKASLLFLRVAWSVGDERAGTPPLRTRPDTIEVMVTGRLRRARIVVPIGDGPEMADT